MVVIKKVELAEASALLDFSKKTFYHFFGPLNSPQNMEAYASVAFTEEKIFTELSNPNSSFYFAMIDDQIAGYLKLNFNDAQTEFKDAKALEVERIYVAEEYHKLKIGKQLLNFALNMAKSKDFAYVWLGVWDQNYNAIGFYEHNRFKQFSRHDFWLGDDKQVDLLMKKEL